MSYYSNLQYDETMTEQIVTPRYLQLETLLNCNTVPFMVKGGEGKELALFLVMPADPPYEIGVQTNLTQFLEHSTGK